jgi:predicted amidohydrolase
MHLRSISIQTRDLEQRRPDSARIVIAQARWLKDNWVKRDGLYFHRSLDPARHFIERILNQTSQRLANLVVFPELSVPESLIDVLRDYSERAGAIIVGGSHYSKGRDGYVGRSPIIINGTVYFTEKIVPAPAESSMIEGQGLQGGSTLYVFKNTSVGNFAVLICSDYLDEATKNAIPLNELDLLIVPAFQGDSGKYHVRMHIDCEESPHGLYIAYSNNDFHPHGDGRSAFFAYMDRTFVHQAQEAGYTNGNPEWKVCELQRDQTSMILQVDLKQKKPYAGKNVRTRSNVELLRVNVEEDDDADAFANAIAHADERYVMIKELFVAPREYHALVDKLESSKLVFIVGDPGIGKTYTAARLLREYFDRGFQPAWHAGIEREERVHQRQILDNYRPGNQQIVYFEDPFGRSVYEPRDTLNRIFGPLFDHLAEIDARVIITSRREVFEEFRLAAATFDFSALTEELNVVKPSYSIDALAKILDKLGASAKWYQDRQCRTLVQREINAGRLNTPLAIRHFIFSTENVTKVADVSERLKRRRVEQRTMFAEEIAASGARTKLVLAGVLLFGGHPVSRLDEWFTNVASFVDPSPRNRTFADELRRQLGYRVEQYGMLATVLRFIHPLYEEAFVEACTTDAMTYDVACSLLKLVARTNVTTAVAAALRPVSKYPDLARNLLSDVMVIVQSLSDLFELGQFGLRLLALQRQTGDSRFLDLAVRLSSLDDLASRINEETDLNKIAVGFRYFYHYADRLERAGRLGLQWRGEYSKKINWTDVFERWRTAPHIFLVLEAIEFALKLAPARIRRFGRDLDLEEFIPKFNRLSQPEQERLGPVVRKWLPETAKLDGHPPITIRERIQQWLSSADRDHKGVIVDAGGVAAVKKHYSLLPVGITSVVGDFGRGEAISIFDEERQLIGAGVVAYSSEEIRQIRGRHSSLITDKLPDDRGRAVVHSERLVLIGPAGE